MNEAPALDHKKTIEDILENSQHLWCTLLDVAREASISERDVLDYINRYPRIFVQSSTLSRDGLPLYTTRRRLREDAPLFVRLVGAFKNRAA